MRNGSTASVSAVSSVLVQFGESRTLVELDTKYHGDMIATRNPRVMLKVENQSHTEP